MLCGVLFQFLVRGRPAAAAAVVEGELARSIPSFLPTWRSVDEPLGPNEAIRGRVEDILRYDDYVFRRYVKGGREFSIYMAYWRPGKMPTRLVAEHTPDRCWVENGWACEQRSSKKGYSIGQRAILPAEWRSFSPPLGGGNHHVLFWLIDGGLLHDYEAHQMIVSHATSWWRGVMREAVGRGNSEKLFVRVAATVPFEQLWFDREFQTVMTKVADLGLWESAGGGETVKR